MGKELARNLAVEEGKAEVWREVANTIRGNIGTDQTVSEFYQLASQSEGFRSWIFYHLFPSFQFDMKCIIYIF